MIVGKGAVGDSVESLGDEIPIVFGNEIWYSIEVLSGEF